MYVCMHACMPASVELAMTLSDLAGAENRYVIDTELNRTRLWGEKMESIRRPDLPCRRRRNDINPFHVSLFIPISQPIAFSISLLRPAVSPWALCAKQCLVRPATNAGNVSQSVFRDKPQGSVRKLEMVYPEIVYQWKWYRWKRYHWKWYQWKWYLENWNPWNSAYIWKIKSAYFLSSFLPFDLHPSIFNLDSYLIRLDNPPTRCSARE